MNTLNVNPPKIGEAFILYLIYMRIIIILNILGIDQKIIDNIYSNNW